MKFMAELKEKFSESAIREIIAQKEISGADLNEIRNELDVAIEKYYQKKSRRRFPKMIPAPAVYKHCINL